MSERENRRPSGQEKREVRGEKKESAERKNRLQKPGDAVRFAHEKRTKTNDWMEKSRKENAMKMYGRLMETEWKLARYASDRGKLHAILERENGPNGELNKLNYKLEWNENLMMDATLVDKGSQSPRAEAGEADLSPKQNPEANRFLTEYSKVARFADAKNGIGARLDGLVSRRDGTVQYTENQSVTLDRLAKDLDALEQMVAKGEKLSDAAKNVSMGNGQTLGQFLESVRAQCGAFRVKLADVVMNGKGELGELGLMPQRITDILRTNPDPNSQEMIEVLAKIGALVDAMVNQPGTDTTRQSRGKMTREEAVKAVTNMFSGVRMESGKEVAGYKVGVYKLVLRPVTWGGSDSSSNYSSQMFDLVLEHEHVEQAIGDLLKDGKMSDAKLAKLNELMKFYGANDRYIDQKGSSEYRAGKYGLALAEKGQIFRDDERKTVTQLEYQIDSKSFKLVEPRYRRTDADRALEQQLLQRFRSYMEQCVPGKKYEDIKWEDLKPEQQKEATKLYKAYEDQLNKGPDAANKEIKDQQKAVESSNKGAVEKIFDRSGFKIQKGADGVYEVRELYLRTTYMRWSGDLLQWSIDGKGWDHDFTKCAYTEDSMRTKHGDKVVDDAPQIKNAKMKFNNMLRNIASATGVQAPDEKTYPGNVVDIPRDNTTLATVEGYQEWKDSPDVKATMDAFNQGNQLVQVSMDDPSKNMRIALLPQSPTGYDFTFDEVRTLFDAELKGKKPGECTQVFADISEKLSKKFADKVATRPLEKARELLTTLLPDEQDLLRNVMYTALDSRDNITPKNAKELVRAVENLKTHMKGIEKKDREFFRPADATKDPEKGYLEPAKIAEIKNILVEAGAYEEPLGCYNMGARFIFVGETGVRVGRTNDREQAKDDVSNGLTEHDEQSLRINDALRAIAKVVGKPGPDMAKCPGMHDVISMNRRRVFEQYDKIRSIVAISEKGVPPVYAQIEELRTLIKKLSKDEVQDVNEFLERQMLTQQKTQRKFFINSSKDYALSWYIVSTEKTQQTTMVVTLDNVKSMVQSSWDSDVSKVQKLLEPLGPIMQDYLDEQPDKAKVFQESVLAKYSNIKNANSIWFKLQFKDGKFTLERDANTPNAMSDALDEFKRTAIDTLLLQDGYAMNEENGERVYTKGKFIFRVGGSYQLPDGARTNVLWGNGGNANKRLATGLESRGSLEDHRHQALLQNIAKAVGEAGPPSGEETQMDYKEIEAVVDHIRQGIKNGIRAKDLTMEFVADVRKLQEFGTRTNQDFLRYKEYVASQRFVEDTAQRVFRIDVDDAFVIKQDMEKTEQLQQRTIESYFKEAQDRFHSYDGAKGAADVLGLPQFLNTRFSLETHSGGKEFMQAMEQKYRFITDAKTLVVYQLRPNAIGGYEYRPIPAAQNGQKVEPGQEQLDPAAKEQLDKQETPKKIKAAIDLMVGISEASRLGQLSNLVRGAIGEYKVDYDGKTARSKMVQTKQPSSFTSERDVANVFIKENIGKVKEQYNAMRLLPPYDTTIMPPNMKAYFREHLTSPGRVADKLAHVHRQLKQWEAFAKEWKEYNDDPRKPEEEKPYEKKADAKKYKKKPTRMISNII